MVGLEKEIRDNDERSADAWVLLAECASVKVYGLRRPASLRDVLEDREAAGGNPRQHTNDKQTNGGER